MPYKYGYRNKKRSVARRVRKFKKRVAKRGSSLMASYLSAQKNHFDLAGAVSLSTSGMVNSAQNIVLGTGSSNRSGDTVALSSYYMNFSTQIADTFNWIKIWLVLDKSSNGALPAITDVFNIPSSGIVSVSPQLVAQKEETRYRFKILRSALIRMDTDEPIKHCVFKGKFKKLIKSTYLDNTGSATAFGQNQLYVMAMSDSLLSSHPTLNYNTRVYYYN